MDYDEALKKVRAATTKEGFVIVKMSYDCTLVLPHKDGLALLDTLKYAEQFENGGGYTPKYIVPLERDKVEFTVLSRHGYEQYKLSALLNITLDEAKALHPTQPKSE